MFFQSMDGANFASNRLTTRSQSFRQNPMVSCFLAWQKASSLTQPSPGTVSHLSGPLSSRDYAEVREAVLDLYSLGPEALAQLRKELTQTAGK